MSFFNSLTMRKPEAPASAKSSSLSPDMQTALAMPGGLWSLAQRLRELKAKRLEQQKASTLNPPSTMTAYANAVGAAAKAAQAIRKSAGGVNTPTVARPTHTASTVLTGYALGGK